MSPPRCPTCGRSVRSSDVILDHPEARNPSGPHPGCPFACLQGLRCAADLRASEPGPANTRRAVTSNLAPEADLTTPQPTLRSEREWPQRVQSRDAPRGRPEPGHRHRRRRRVEQGSHRQTITTAIRPISSGYEAILVPDQDDGLSEGPRVLIAVRDEHSWSLTTPAIGRGGSGTPIPESTRSSSLTQFARSSTGAALSPDPGVPGEGRPPPSGPRFVGCSWAGAAVTGQPVMARLVDMRRVRLP